MFGGVWTPGTAAQVIAFDLTPTALVDEVASRRAAGLGLVSVASHLIDGTLRHTVLFEPVPSTARQAISVERTAEQLVADYGVQWNAQNKIVSLSTQVKNGVPLFSAVWRENPGGQFLAVDRTLESLLAEYSTWWDRGFRLIQLSSYLVNGEVRYAAVWNPSTTNQFLAVERTEASFLAEDAKWRGRGFALAAVTSFTRDGVVYYSAIWNAGGAGDVPSLNLPARELGTTLTAQLGAQKKLRAVFFDHAEAFDTAKFAEQIRADLDLTTVGYSVSVGDSKQRVGIAGGLSRTTVDGTLASAATHRFNVASITKTLTATAVQKFLPLRGLSLDTKIGPYLPADWERGPNIDDITVRELITHTSGMRAVKFNGQWVDTYDSLKEAVRTGISLSKKRFSYSNQGYALFRILFPYFLGNGPELDALADGPRNTRASQIYIAALNTYVFAPAGIATVTSRPVAGNKLAYPFPAGDIGGTDFGDMTEIAGAMGPQLSTDDLVRYLVALNAGRILPPAQLQAMRDGNLGFQRGGELRHGTFNTHAGYLFMPTANGKAEINARVYSITSGVQIAIELTSAVAPTSTLSFDAAYNASWRPI